MPDLSCIKKYFKYYIHIPKHCLMKLGYHKKDFSKKFCIKKIYDNNYNA